MIFSLHKLKKNKSGQGSLVAIILGCVLLSTIVASSTSWYISMRNNLSNTEDKLEAQTIAQSEWERLSHMSLDELEANRNNFKTPYSAGTESQYSVSVNLGEKGTFNNGTCGAVSGGYANCFKNTTITVYRDGNRMFTTRTLPLMAGDYTRREIDTKFSAEAKARSDKDTDLQNQINNLTARLNGKEFVKNRTTAYDLNLRYEKKGSDTEMKIHAYNGNTEIPLSGGGMRISFEKRVKLPNNSNWIAPSDGFIIDTGTNGCADPWASINRKIYVNGLEIADMSEGDHGESNVNISFPIRKGDTFKINTNFTPGYTYFYPLE